MFENINWGRAAEFVVNAGWWVANANRVKDVVNRAADIADERSKDCTKIFQNAIESMLQKGSEIIDDWNNLTKRVAVCVVSFGLKYLFNKLSDENGAQDYPSYLTKVFFDAVTTLVPCCVLFEMLGVINISKLLFSRQSNSKLDVSEVKMCGVKKNEPSFLVHKLFESKKYITVENEKLLKVEIGLVKRAFYILTPHRLSGKFLFRDLTTVKVKDKSIAKVKVEKECIKITPRDNGDNLEISLLEFFCYKETRCSSSKLDHLKLRVYSSSRKEETIIEITRRKDNPALNFANVVGILEEIKKEIEKSEKMIMLKVSRNDINGQLREELAESSLRDVLVVNSN